MSAVSSISIPCTCGARHAYSFALVARSSVFLIGDRAPHAQREESRLTGEVRIDDLGTVLIHEHNFLSTDLVISGLKMLSKARIMTQSELLEPLASILRFGSAARASSSVRAMRTSRQSMCSHAELASSSIMHRMHAAVG
jgi:hypothetical protein